LDLTEKELIYNHMRENDKNNIRTNSN